MVLLDNASPVVRVTLNDLSRLPVERLARLLLERAAEDPMLLTRLHATIEEGTPGVARVAPSSPSPGPAHVVGDSPAIRHAGELIRRFARSDDPVLLTGESGTGKELAARAIHEGSRRTEGPFVAVNCAAIPSNLVASELFGYEKGAFTGAHARTKGQIEHANGGTLFLDEIGDMPVDLQGHLLRFLQDGQIVRVGGRETINVNVRIVAATNVRLREAIAEGRFREDLYYRLNVLTLPLPPLRERHEDIEPLARHFLAAAARDFGRDVTEFEPEALAALRRHSWPGNVRELMSTVRRAVVIGDGDKVQMQDLIGIEDAPRPAPVPPPLPAPAAKVLPRAGSPEERAALLAALERHSENVTLTAQELGVSRVTLYRMLRRHSVMLERGLKEPPVTRGDSGQTAYRLDIVTG
ncbi:MAG TPA: sigma 54-interacting transcriptional regulator [Acetobacteraceae bacterium]|jgi:transcriptional regulator with PAS, ATPase and Fis domain|nr:sigma 54-interacting transcriptional regulator [Acetobacteraceae bacterium]